MPRSKTIADITTLSPEKRQAVQERIATASLDGRLPCAKALSIAKSLEISSTLVGMVADQMNIRVHKCQLGCF